MQRCTVECLGRTKEIAFRPNTSDGAVIRQIFVEKQYDLRTLPSWRRIQSIHDAIVASGRTPLIIDGGANIGASVVWFGAMFPKAEIIAIEPAEANLPLLRENVPDAILVAGALSSLPDSVTVDQPLAHSATSPASRIPHEIAIRAPPIRAFLFSRATTPAARLQPMLIAFPEGRSQLHR